MSKRIGFLDLLLRSVSFKVRLADQTEIDAHLSFFRAEEDKKMEAVFQPKVDLELKSSKKSKKDGHTGENDA